MLAIAEPAAAQHALVFLPLHDLAYEQLGSLARQGCRDAEPSLYRPYTIGAIRLGLTRAATNPRCTGRLLDALTTRFLPAVTSIDADSDSVAVFDSTGIARLVPASTVSSRGEQSSFQWGGELTVRATAIVNGDFVNRWQDVLPIDEGTPSLVGIGRLRASWSSGNSLVAVAEAYGETSRQNDPLSRQRALRNTSGAVDFSEAYINGKIGPIVASFGRSREAWLGDGTESLMLSANGPPLDRLTLAGKWRKVEAHFLLATLEDVILDPARDSSPPELGRLQMRRVFIGHALTVSPSRSLDITLGETALITRAGPALDFAYMNPLMVLLVTQNDSSRLGSDARDNLGTFGAATVHVGSARLTGELFVDDIQIDPKDRKLTPDQLAWRLQGVAPIPINTPASIGADYRHINSFTYERPFYSENYQTYDRPLGSELGPDADAARLFADVWPSGWLRLSGAVGSWRHGAIRLAKRPPPGAEGHAGEPFPSTNTDRPLVQTAVTGDLALQWANQRLPVTLRVQSAHINNVNNQPGASALHMLAQIEGSYAFRYP